MASDNDKLLISHSNPTMLAAIPHKMGLYNINFYENNKCHIAACGLYAQSMSFEVTGKYSFTFDQDNNGGKLHIENDNKELDGAIDVDFKIERGTIYLGNDTITSWKDKIIIAREIYIFDYDPIAMLRIKSWDTYSKDSLDTLMENYQEPIYNIFYASPFKSYTVLKLDKQDVDFTNNGYFKFKFDNFGYITDYNKEIYEELIQNCDYIDNLAYADGYETADNDNFSNKVICDNIITRSNKKSTCKLLSNGATEMVVYYNKDIDTIGYYILENTSYYDKDTEEHFSLVFIHAMETTPKSLVVQPTNYSEDGLVGDMIDNMHKAINDEWRSPHKKFTIILPDYLEEFCPKFEKIGFVKSPVYDYTLKYQYKIGLFYEELKIYGFDDFDEGMDAILWNTNIVI